MLKLNRNEFLNTFWRYYEILESDFVNTIRYVSLCSENFNTYSIEYARLLQDICSEVEVLLKEICGIHNKIKYNYYTLISKLKESKPDLFNYTVSLKKYFNHEIKPFECEEEKSVPNWWTSHNNVKHYRKQSMIESTQQNVLYALAALFLLEEYLLNEIANRDNDIDIMDEESKIFQSDIYHRCGKDLFYETVGELEIEDGESLPV